MAQANAHQPNYKLNAEIINDADGKTASKRKR